MPREAEVLRKTKETNIELSLLLEGTGKITLNTGLPFFEHLLTQVAHHGSFNLEINATGDMPNEHHHLIEDLGLCLGKALAEALGDKKGITRYGHCVLPMDDALVLVALDLSGRPFLNYDFEFAPGNIGELDTEMIEEFLRAFTNEAKLTLHVKKLAGENKHHLAEALFKALGRALKEAVRLDQNLNYIPSTKGVL